MDKLREDDIELRINFLSVDNKIAINSYGDYFKIGDVVHHEGAPDNETATITKFEIIPNDEIKVYTTLGTCHLDFIYKNESS